MNREKVIELAQQCQLIGTRPHLDGIYAQSLQQFVALIEREVRGDAEPPSNKYNEKRIAWELERTAMGDGYYGNALYVAMDMAQTTESDRQMLHRYMHGANLNTDHVKLQDLAMRIYNSQTSAAPAVVQQLVGAVERLREKAKWINDEQAIVGYNEMMEVKAALAAAKEAGL